MRHITRTIAQEVLDEMDGTFDAHDFERRLLRRFPTEFACELLRFANCNDSLRSFSATLSRWLDTSFKGQLQKLPKRKTPNLGGRANENREWMKVHSPHRRRRRHTRTSTKSLSGRSSKTVRH
jgi:hypothetical protein